MAPKDSSMLRQILDQQIQTTTEVKNLTIRLFGAEGQKGSIPILFEKHEHLVTVVQGVKDEALSAVQGVKDKEIGDIKTKIIDLETGATITQWKTGAISSIAGSAIGIGITVLVKKLLGIHS